MHSLLLDEVLPVFISQLCERYNVAPNMLVLALLRNLKLEIIVEGVETWEQAMWLSEYPDVSMQGFYFRRPVAALQQALQNVRVCADPPLRRANRR
ncbi:EAL domain-containing protein [Paraburkholderia phenazinium]|uniref:EAL domain-containing protein n=1 Tax=Paraburkholderia phenazinium TaxID=60549 RepID=A0A1G8J0E4_9BURK|nr:EAL domain-containing protein [Paraburkholderia phenazinium]SDI24542.1 EAL domain-containing protein [Paraburkholderia phenazinium]